MKSNKKEYGNELICLPIDFSRSLIDINWTCIVIECLIIIDNFVYSIGVEFKTNGTNMWRSIEQ